MFEPNPSHNNHNHSHTYGPQDLTEPPVPSRTPEPDFSRMEASLKSQHMAHNFSSTSSSSMAEEYGQLPAFLKRRHSSNYQSALNTLQGTKPRANEPEVHEAHPQQQYQNPTTITPSYQTNSYDDYDRNQQSLEETKRLMQRGSIDLENARSTDQFSVQYHGTRRDSTELRNEEADLRFQKKHPDHLKKYHHNETCVNGHDDPQCSPGFCFHSNQLVSQEQLGGGREERGGATGYPESFEYNDFKRRMSFHD